MKFYCGRSGPRCQIIDKTCIIHRKTYGIYPIGPSLIRIICQCQKILFKINLFQDFRRLFLFAFGNFALISSRKVKLEIFLNFVWIDKNFKWLRPRGFKQKEKLQIQRNLTSSDPYQNTTVLKLSYCIKS